MPSPTDDGKETGVSGVLDDAFIRIYNVKVSALRLTTVGRPIREAGVKDMIQSIREDGFLTSSMPYVITLDYQAAKRLTDNRSDDATNLEFRVLDGNNRVEALRRLDREHNEQQNEERDTIVAVRVHCPVGAIEERILADRLNQKSAMTVKLTVLDKLSLYQQFILDEQRENPKTSVGAMANHIVKYYVEARIRPPGLTTAKSYVKTTLNLKDGAWAALQDVTHLTGRKSGHRDLKDLKFDRISMHSLQREDFKSLCSRGQQAFIYRLACHRKSTLSQEEFATLSNSSRSIGRVVSDIEAVAPEDKWPQAFKKYMHDLMAYMSPNCFGSHISGRDLEVRRYKQECDSHKPNPVEYDEEHIAKMEGQIMLSARAEMAKPENQDLAEVLQAHMDDIASSHSKSKAALTVVVNTTTPSRPATAASSGRDLEVRRYKQECDSHKPNPIEYDEEHITKMEGQIMLSARTEMVKPENQDLAEVLQAHMDDIASSRSKAKAALTVAVNMTTPSRPATTAFSSPTRAVDETGNERGRQAPWTRGAASSTETASGGRTSANRGQQLAADSEGGTSTDGWQQTPAEKCRSEAEPQEASGKPIRNKRKRSSTTPVVKGTPRNDNADNVRNLVSSVVHTDVIKKIPSPDLPLSLVRKATLVFLNIARDAFIVCESNPSNARLPDALRDVSVIIADNGTLVMALDHTTYDARGFIQRSLESVGFIMDPVSLISLYLGGKVGRVARKARQFHRQQSALTIVAHKRYDFVCRRDESRTGRLSRAAAARDSLKDELQEIGAIVCDQHPPNSTFLSLSTAEYCLKRYTDPNDLVVTTDAMADKHLANAILGSGRLLGTYVADKSHLAEMEKTVAIACATAVKRGLFVATMKIPTVIGHGVLPLHVPRDNLPANTISSLAELREEQEDSGGVQKREHERVVAKEIAASFGLEIKESAVHGYGVFAGKGLSPEFPGIPVEGSFHVFDSFSQVYEEVEADGVPIFLVGDAECLRKMCDKHESVRQGALLCLKPSACNPWSYTNSSRKSTSHPDLEANLKRDARFAYINKKLKTIKDSQEALRVAGNVLTLTVDQSVKKGTDLFIDYPFIACVREAQDDSEMEVE